VDAVRVKSAGRAVLQLRNVLKANKKLLFINGLFVGARKVNLMHAFA
jgi:hypothetical protein